MNEAKNLAPVDEPAITPMRMLEIAVEQNADLDKLSKLMDLQERWEANEARKAFVTALNAFKAAPPTIGKNKHVSFDTQKGHTEYYHATLDNVCESIGAGLSENGLSHRWEVDQPGEGVIKVTCVLTHEKGHSERVSLQAGADQSGGKNNIQAVASTVTYLERYTLLAATGLASKDQDDDGAAVEKISESQKESILDLLKQLDSERTPKFLKYMEVESVDDIPATKIDRAISALNNEITKAK